MVGSAIWRNLESKGYTNLIGRSSKELDLRNQAQVETFFEKENRLICTPFYKDDLRTLSILANNFFREKNEY